MLRFRKALGEAYSPMYFLAALGSGGLAVSFFMYLMFLTPHPETPIPVYESWLATLQTGNPVMQGMIVTALAGVILFTLLHLRLLFWNVREFRLFRRTSAYQRLKQSNAEVQLMAIPLTFAMTINVGFIVGALFVPALWTVVEYLFPFAIIAFGVAGYYTLLIFVNFMSRVLVTGNFDCARNNSLSQMLSIFAFTMVGVGFSASAAMSQVRLTSGIAMVLALMFLSMAAVVALAQFVMGFRAMFQHGIDREGAVSLWIIIPIITLSGIAIYRIGMGMHHNFGVHLDPVGNLALLSVFVSIQGLFGVLGYVVMRKLGYFREFVSGTGKSVASYALICPGVASFVMAFFFIHAGLVASGLLVKFSPAHLILLVPLVLLQLQTILTLWRLNGKLLSPEVTPAPAGKTALQSARGV
ncbi:MAG: hypothetical protein KDI15_01590 [Thiothrix sp.]|nr:hypothetical protein [Thiothrix sp.]HPE60188.1 hypothetical protein [Thiolinea sp.]